MQSLKIWFVSLLLLLPTIVITTTPASAATPSQTYGAGIPIANVPQAKITGTAIVGNTLTGVPGTWPRGVQLAYKWLKNGDPISGATSTTLTLDGTYVGSTVQFRVTGTATGYNTASSTSVATATVVRPAIPVQGAPKITSNLNNVRVGATLTASAGTWSAGTQTGIQWLVDGQSIQNTGTTLVVTSAMQGKVISITVTAYKEGYATATKTAATAAVAKGIITKNMELTLGADGGYKVGYSIGLSWDVSPDRLDVDYTTTYVWKLDGKTVPGATESSYQLRQADLGKKLSAVMTISLAGYQDLVLTSNTSSAVQPLYPAIPVQGAPKITSSLSSVRVGATLTASAGTWSAGTQTAIQWLVDGQSIQNTGTTLDVTPEMQGKVISITVSASKNGYASATKTAATAAVAKGIITQNQGLTLGADGTLRVGSIIGLNWDVSPRIQDVDYTFTYVWKVNGTTVSGANASQYQVGQSDLGKKISAVLTISLPGYQTLVLTSNTSAAVQRALLVN